MGHSSIKVTMDIYGHLMEATNHEAANKIGATIFGHVVDNGSKMVAEKEFFSEKTFREFSDPRGTPLRRIG